MRYSFAPSKTAITFGVCSSSISVTATAALLSVFAGKLAMLCKSSEQVLAVAEKHLYWRQRLAALCKRYGIWLAAGPAGRHLRRALPRGILGL